MSVADKLETISINERFVHQAGYYKGYNEGYNVASTEVYGEGYGAGWNEGYDQGEMDGHARCTEKHFATTVLGNGETSISFQIPFEPDCLLINCGDSDLFGASTAMVASVYLDLASFGMIGGVGQVGTTGGFKNQAMTTTSIYNRYSRAEDGTVTLGNINSSTVSVFKANRPYVVFAVKYVEQTDKERITEYVRSLGDSGSVTLNQAKVSAAFSDEEWAALIAEKPGWTFSFI